MRISPQRLAICALALLVAAVFLASNLDRTAARLARGLDNDLSLFLRGYSEIGNSLFPLAAFAGGWLVFRFLRRREALARFLVFAFAAVAAVGAAAALLKIIFGRTRPGLYFDAGLYEFTWFALSGSAQAFPSGHSSVVGATMTALALAFPRYGAWILLFGVSVAAARVGMGFHYPSDAIVGFVFGHLGALAIAEIFYRRGWWTPPGWRIEATAGQYLQ